MKTIVYLNGSFLPEDQANISTIDMAYLYGYGVFESLRIYNGVPFRLDRHLTRLAKGASFLGINRPDPKIISDAVHQLTERNRNTHARVRITVSTTGLGIVPTLPKNRAASLFIATMPLDLPSIEQAQRNGVSAMISRKARRAIGELSAVKGTAQALGIIAQSEAHAAGCDEAILLNEKDMLAEGSFSNVFLVKGRTLITPDLGSGILPGITRETILALAENNKIPVEERKVKSSEAAQANEIFLTNSIREIIPVVEMDGRVIGNGKPGVISKRLLSAYKTLVKKETAARD